MAKEKRDVPVRVALVSVGLLLLIWFVVSLLITQTSGTEKRTTTPGSQTTTSSSSTTSSGTATTPSTTTASSTTASPGGVSKETSDSAPSEAVLLALLSTGSILVLAGGLYTRLNTIKLPGNTEITLTPEEATTVAGGVAENAPPATSAERVAQATAAAMAAAQAQKTKKKAPLNAGEIASAARAGVRAAGLTSGPARTPAIQRAGSGRLLNVVLGPGSDAHRATRPPGSRALAAGFQPQPAWNLTQHAGRVIENLTFINCYLGPAGAWADTDMQSIDGALEAALNDERLEAVIAQYGVQPGARMLASRRHESKLPPTVHKDAAEQLAREIFESGALGEADPADSVICLMLPEAVVLSDGFSPGFRPPAGAVQETDRRRSRTITLDDGDAASSRQGLGGYHGSIHVPGTTIYYAVGVYSKGSNGIPAFPDPWRSVVATFYHELNEARTDPDVEDVNSSESEDLLGWYSATGQGEIGDLPINACGEDLGRVFIEVALADGSGDVPVQLMWSNAASGPAASV